MVTLRMFANLILIKFYVFCIYWYVTFSLFLTLHVVGFPRTMAIRVFQKYKFSLFVNGDENVAVYGPYEANKKIIRIIDAFPLKCTTVLYIQRKFRKKIQRKIQSDLYLTKMNIFICL